MRGRFLLSRSPTRTAARWARDFFKGGWTIVFFGFTTCPDICPTTLATLSKATRQLSDLPAAEQPRVLLITVDPERDDPAKLAAFVRFFDPAFLGATGDAKSVAAAAAAFGVPFARVDLPEGGYTMDHGSGVFFVGPERSDRGVFVRAARCRGAGPGLPQGRGRSGGAPMKNRDDDAYADGVGSRVRNAAGPAAKACALEGDAPPRPQHRPVVRKAFIGTILRAYPTIDMREAEQPDPYAYASFNAFFARALRAG